MNVALDIFVTDHAMWRAAERFPYFDTVTIEGEVRAALEARRCSPERHHLGLACFADPTSLYVWTADGERIYVQRWQPRDGARAVMVLSHGLAEHAGSYLPFVEHFVGRGVAVYAHDHRGFGRSEGRRGHVPHYTRYVDDLVPLVQRARAENPGVPLVLVRLDAARDLSSARMRWHASAGAMSASSSSRSISSPP